MPAHLICSLRWMQILMNGLQQYDVPVQIINPNGNQLQSTGSAMVEKITWRAIMYAFAGHWTLQQEWS